MRTRRQQRGVMAEELAVGYCESLGWSVVDRNVKLGRDEIDIMAVDPGPPAELVFVEVRSATSAAFGAPEERLDRRKIAHLYRAMSSLPTTFALPRRVDLVVVDARDGRLKMRHLRRLEPG